MKYYILRTNAKAEHTTHKLLNGYNFKINNLNAERLISDAKDDEIFYLLYNISEKKFVEQGVIKSVESNKPSNKYEALFAERKPLNINYLPVLNPDIVTGVSLMTLFVFLNVNFGMTTMLLSHLVFDIPYVILSVLPKLKQLPANIEEAALDLGATPSYALRKIILPQLKPGIISGALMAFTMSIDDFVISFFTTGNGVSNLSIEIYSMTRRGLTPEINALSTLMFIVVLALLITSNIVGNKKTVEN